MNKNEWISAKIAKLVGEGKPQQQAIAIAYSMWERGDHKQEGGIPMAQQGLYYQQNNPYFMQNPGQIPITQDVVNNGQTQNVPNKNETIGSGAYQKTDYSSPTNTEGLAEGYQYDDSGNIVQKKQDSDWVKYNILNPYGQGMDLNTSLAYTGQQFAKGNTGMGIAGAGLSALKGVKSFLSGYSSGKGQKTLEQQMYEQQYNSDEKLYQVGGYTEEELYNQDLINKYPNSAEINNRLSKPTEVLPTPAEEVINTAKEITNDKKYDNNSARDTWVQKTGLPWSEAKRLGYTDGTAKDNTKLLKELNDTRFKKENIRSIPFTAPVQAAKADAATVAKAVKIQNYFNSPEYKSLPKSKKAQAELNAVKDAGGWGAIERVGELLGNPFYTFGEYAKYKELPAKGFSKENSNAYDNVLGLINPANWATHAANAVDYTEQGEYAKAAGEAAGALPAAGKLLRTVKYIPYLQGLPEASTAARAAGYLEQGAKRIAPTTKGIKQLGQGWGGVSDKFGNYISGSYAPHYQQGGFIQGEEYDLTEEEIQDLVSRGYKIKYK